ncbi:hypothetical protein [Bradyrhizobium sp. 153]|uniref:hypothetical protein n=1 Tax=Bradyrhizobium sp. 153 TaxID=2782627 RepID=UPI001FF792B0|nr:hypothetical protein [Bradyrhizobium sp. 153]MCK1669408.1 hypothetical protein [Bradyrhizobium sp. 153]
MDDSAAGKSQVIKTAAGVIEALGGTVAAARVGETTPQSMTNARTRNRLPYPTFLILTEALSALGKSADPRLWGIKPVKRRGG